MEDTSTSTSTSTADSPIALPAPHNPSEDGEVFKRVDKLRLRAVLRKARKGLPESASVCNTISLHLKHPSDYEFYVPCDRCLNTIILYRKVTDKMQYTGFISQEKPEVLMKLLASTRLFYWSVPVSFLHLPENLNDRITLLFKTMAGDKPHIHSVPSTLYVMDKRRQKSVPLRCPKGYKICQMRNEAVKTAMEAWHLKPTWTKDMYQDFLSSVPSVGLYVDSARDSEREVDIKKLPEAVCKDLPIAFAVVSSTGALWVMEANQKNWVDGLMALLVQTGGRVMTAENLVPHLYVSDLHESLEGLMGTLPGWRTEGKVRCVWDCFGSFCP